jgi:hypothetical protein
VGNEASAAWLSWDYGGLRGIGRAKPVGHFCAVRLAAEIRHPPRQMAGRRRREHRNHEGFLAIEVHSPFSLMHRSNRYVGRLVPGNTGRSMYAAVHARQPASQGRHAATAEDLNAVSVRDSLDGRCRGLGSLGAAQCRNRDAIGEGAEVSAPLFAPRTARKAPCNLAQAARIDPRNDEHLRELVEFYLDSLEWLRTSGLIGSFVPER